MRTYVQIQDRERHVIQKMLYSQNKITTIAQRLERDRTTINREIKRNKTRGYNYNEASLISKERRYKKKRKLDKNGALSLIVVSMLLDGNSPEVISYSLKLLFPDDLSMRISHESIYQWIYSKKKKKTLCSFLFTSRKKRQKRSNLYKRRCVDKNKKNIRSRPVEANNKEEIGHYEGDLIESAGKDKYILTLVDRKSEYTHAILLPDKDSNLTARAVVEAFEGINTENIKTITFDNGTEFSKYSEIEKALNCNVYFADPYCSWQRGLNEHINGRIRYYLPKKKSFRHITDDDLDLIINKINTRPRKSRDWKMPEDIYIDALVT